jgi:hypothetical protein
MFFAGAPPLPKTTLFVRSNWEPPYHEIDIELRAKVRYFSLQLERLFPNQTCRPNLLPSQLATFNQLRERDDLVIISCDKNLGPAILERRRYIELAHSEHLSNSSTYRQLTETTALNRIKAIKNIIKQFVDKYLMEFDNHERKVLSSDGRYIIRCLDQTEDPFSYFYLLAKIHKTPMSTRPIVSCSGSILFGLGRWLDCQLQTLCKHLPYRVKSSADLVDQLKQLGRLPASARLFTCDAQSMYTNINTQEAIALISTYLRSSESPCFTTGIDPEAVIAAIKIVMSHNVFKFGDTFWIQLQGTAMGTPPAPMYATLFFAILEMSFIHLYKQVLPFYCRFIDDGHGVWSPRCSSNDREEWEQFKTAFNALSSLQWDFSPLSTSINFLDLQIEIVDGHIRTRLYEKALNLYLYLPPHSAHPPGMLRGLIHGMVTRIFRLSSESQDAVDNCRQFGRRLIARGYSASVVIGLINKSINAWHNRPMLPRVSTSTAVPPLFLHIPYHPRNIASSKIQALFRRVFFCPSGTLLPAFRNPKTNATLGINRLIVAYSRPRNLGNFFSPRKLVGPGVAVSAIIEDTRRNPDPIYDHS